MCGRRAVSHERLSFLQPWDGLDRELDQLGACVGCCPFAVIPCCAAEVVAGVEVLDEAHLTEGGDGEECRGFHFDGKASLALSSVDPSGGLPVGGVGSPSGAQREGHCAFVEDLAGDRDGGRVGMDLSRWGGVVKGGALIPHCGSGNDHMTEGHTRLRT